MAGKKEAETPEEDPQARYNVPDVETVRKNMAEEAPAPAPDRPSPRDEDDAPKS